MAIKLNLKNTKNKNKMATKQSEQDEQVQKLFKIVQSKREEIAKAEKPNWETNGSFAYDKNSSSRINIHVVADIDELISILGYVLEKDKHFQSAQDILGTNATFKWIGYTLKEWQYDIQTRISKIQIKKKKDELQELESRLDRLISPELKRQMELEEITKLLS
jgi:hypothetical protein